MSVNPLLEVNQVNLLKGYLSTWEQDGGRPSVYNMPADLTQVLAAANIYTTSIGISDADKPLSRRDYLAKEGYRQDLETIADNTIHALSGDRIFSEAIPNDLGSRLSEIFSAVSSITAHNVHVTKPKMRKGEVIDGTVLAERIVLGIASPAKSVDLMAALQRLLVTADGDVCGVRPVLDENQQITGVEITGLNEHMARSLSRAVEALLAREDRRKYGTLLPGKKSLKVHKENGETFHPKVETRLVAANENYKALELKASYGDSELQAVETNKDPDYNLLCTDGAGMLQGLRDIFNVQIVELRGGTHRNPEQDPDKGSRLRIDIGTDLRRDKATPEEVKRGPLLGRRLSPMEKGQEAAAKASSDLVSTGADIVEFTELVAAPEVRGLALTALKSVIHVRRGLRRAVEIDNLLSERQKLQNRDYFVRRLSWLIHIGRPEVEKSVETEAI